MNIAITTTWNSSSLIGTFLDHYQKLGFDQILVMDFNSSDGTPDIVRSAQYRDFVQLVPFPGLAGKDSSSLMLELAKKIFGPDTGCLFCDPDELLVVPPKTGIAHLYSSRAGAIIVPRFNVTARLSAVLADPLHVTSLGSLNLRIDRRCTRKLPEDLHRDILDPPWIYTAIPGKVFVRLGRAIAIGDGDHMATLSEGQAEEAPPGTYFLHFPMRTYEEFEDKISMYRIDFSSNPQLPETYGWQARRWSRLAEAGRLREEYLQQFPSDDLVDSLIENDALVVDNSVKTLHARSG